MARHKAWDHLYKLLFAAGKKPEQMQAVGLVCGDPLLDWNQPVRYAAGVVVAEGEEIPQLETRTLAHRPAAVVEHKGLAELVPFAYSRLLGTLLEDFGCAPFVEGFHLEQFREFPITSRGRELAVEIHVPLREGVELD
jgi:DNA gyrase inhibitor GyrI